jgi:hypothetical protein
MRVCFAHTVARSRPYCSWHSPPPPGSSLPTPLHYLTLDYTMLCSTPTPLCCTALRCRSCRCTGLHRTRSHSHGVTPPHVRPDPFPLRRQVPRRHKCSHGFYGHLSRRILLCRTDCGHHNGAGRSVTVWHFTESTPNCCTPNC